MLSFKPTSKTQASMVALIFFCMIASVMCLDSPDFWNHASMNIQVTTTTPATIVKVDFYFGWDSAGEYVYFKTRRQYDGWMAIGFGERFSDMDMIVMRLKQLRVVAEDRYSQSSSQLPWLNSLSRDTYLIKGERDSNKIWEIILKRRAVSTDPKKATLDESMRLITIILGDSKDTDMTSIQVTYSTFAMQLTKAVLCHPTCKASSCSGPESNQCTDCDADRVLYLSTCILRQPVWFTNITPSSAPTTISLEFGYSSDKNIVYFRLTQNIKLTWTYWMGIMLDLGYSGATITGITDFYSVYKSSQSNYLVSDYYTDWTTRISTEDELVTDGNNDAFITDSSTNYVTIARYIKTGSAYDIDFDTNAATFNMTLILGSKDLFESETTPFQIYYSIPTPTIITKCDATCKTCIFNDQPSNCLSCPSGTTYLSSTSGVSTCACISNGLCANNNPFSTQTFSLSNYLINENGIKVMYNIQPAGSPVLFSFEVPLIFPTYTPNSNLITIPTWSYTTTYSAVSLYLRDDTVIFLYCNAGSPVTVIDFSYSSSTNLYKKNGIQRVGIQGPSSCINNKLTANIVFDQSGEIVQPLVLLGLSLNLKLHVSWQDRKSITLSSVSTASTTCKSNCATCPIFSLGQCSSCASGSGTNSPVCCVPNKTSLGNGCFSTIPSYWNQIYMNGNDAIVSYSVSGANIFFRYDVKTALINGGFGCGFNTVDYNTDMVIFDLQNLKLTDSYSYGTVDPSADTKSNIIQISATSSVGGVYTGIFVRPIFVDQTVNKQDTNLQGYSGGILCYLGQTASLSPRTREKYLVPSVTFSLSSICHSSCSACSCDPAITTSCEMICTTCIAGYATSSTLPKYQCAQQLLNSCVDSNCAQCSSSSAGTCVVCSSNYFLFQKVCYPQSPEVFYSSEVELAYTDIGFTLAYGFDTAMKHIYFNIQGINNGYIAVGLGSHASGMDIIMIQSTFSNAPIVTDMYSDYTSYISKDTSQDVAYVIGGRDPSSFQWNITVFRPLTAAESKDLSISLTQSNRITIALGVDDTIAFHKSVSSLSTLFPLAQVKGGKVDYQGTYIQPTPVLYNRINNTNIAAMFFYGFDSTNTFIYFKVVSNLTGWVGIGFGDSMTSTDMIIISPKDAAISDVLVEDRFSDGQKTPRLDQSQDVQLLSNDFDSSSKNYTICFVRKLITGDKFYEDTDLTYSSTLNAISSLSLVFAQGVNWQLSSGHSKHVTLRSISLLSTLDCQHCSTGTCTGPMDNDCTGTTASTDTSGSILEVTSIMILLILSYCFI